MPMSDVMLTCTVLDGRNGHEAGRELLARLWPGHPEILVTDRGKPYFQGNPKYFSISHTKKHAFCVLSDVPVGIDAEEMDRSINLKLAEKILSPSEKARFDSAADKQQALLRLWVLKEAAAKLTGEGLKGYPNHTDFDPFDQRIQIIDGCFVAVLKENHYAL